MKFEVIFNREKIKQNRQKRTTLLFTITNSSCVEKGGSYSFLLTEKEADALHFQLGTTLQEIERLKRGGE